MTLSTDAIIHALRLSRPVAYLFLDDRGRAAAELAWGRAVHELASQLPVSARNAFLINVQGETA
jgi:hypothetical protein